MTAFTGSEYFPGGLGEWTKAKGELTVEDGPERGRRPPGGDVLRRRRPGRHLAAVRRDPHPGGRLQRPDDRLGVRQGRVGARPAVLRGHGGVVTGPERSRRGGAGPRVSRRSPASARRRRRSSSRWLRPCSRACSRAGVVRLGPTPPTAALGAPRYVEETATAGLVQTYDGSETYDVGGGLAVLDCDGDGRPDVYAAGGEHPAALFRNTGAVGGALRFERVAGEATDLADVTGAYPLDVDADGVTDLAVLRVGQSQLLRGLGRLPVRTRGRGLGRDADAGLRLRVQRHLGGGRDAADARLRHLPRARRRRRVDHDLLRRTRSSGPTRPGAAYDAPVAADARLLRAVDAVQRLGRVRTAGPAGEQRPPLLRRGGRPGAAVAVRARRVAAAAVHRRRRLGPAPAVGHGDRELRRDRRRLSRGLPHEPGPEHAPDAARRSRPAHLPRPRATGAGSRAPGRRPAATRCPSTAWHPEFQDVNNDGFMDLFVSKGNVNVAARLRGAGPERPVPRPARRLVRAGRRRGGDRALRPRPGAALVDLNLDGLLDLVEVNLGAPLRRVAERRVRHGRRAGRDGQLGRRCRLRAARRQPRRDRRAWSRSRVGDTVIGRREVVVGGGHLSGQLGLDPRRAWARRRRPRSA